MVKKTIGYVELAWTCPHCDSENPGPRKFCTGCGAPQPGDVQFHQLAEAVLLTEEADIRKAKAGPDVHCPYCRARNPGDAAYCGACGGDLTDAEARQSGQIVGAYREAKGLETKCPHCGTLNKSSAMECAGCGASLRGVRADDELKTTVATQKTHARRYVGIGCMALLLLGAAAFLFSLLNKEQATGVVEQVSWERSIPVLGLAPVKQEDWIDQLPEDAEDIECRETLRTTSDEPVSGAVEVCGTPYTIDEGSGFGEVVQDCTYDVYDDFCSYMTTDWAVLGVQTVSGDDLEPIWPELLLGPDQQAGERTAEYSVIFDTSEGTYRYVTDDESEFIQYRPGSSWIIEVNRLGGVSVIEPAR